MLTNKDIQVLDGLLTVLAAYCSASKDKLLELLGDYLFSKDEYSQLKNKKQDEKNQIFDAASKMARFIRTWEDCLSGVQMSEEDFNEDCGLKEWRRAKASVINEPKL
jgi:hypothetical protein